MFAWQALFMLGAWLGRRTLLGAAAVPYRPWLLPVAATVLAVGFVLRLSEHGLIPQALPHWGLQFEDKASLSLPRLLHALCLAYVVSRLVPAQARWMHVAPLPWLAAIGRNSLQVFCLGLFLSYAATLAFRLLPGRTALAGAAVDPRRHRSPGPLRPSSRTEARPGPVSPP